MKITAKEFLRNTKEILKDFEFEEDIEEIKKEVERCIKEKLIKEDTILYIVQLRGVDYLKTANEEWNDVHVQYFELEDEIYFQATDGISFGLQTAVYDSNWKEDHQGGWGIAILTKEDIEASERLKDITAEEEAIEEILNDKNYDYYIESTFNSENREVVKRLIAISKKIEEEQQEEVLDKICCNYVEKFGEASHRLQRFALSANRETLC